MFRPRVSVLLVPLLTELLLPFAIVFATVGVPVRGSVLYKCIVTELLATLELGALSAWLTLKAEIYCACGISISMTYKTWKLVLSRDS